MESQIQTQEYLDPIAPEELQQVTLDTEEILQAIEADPDMLSALAMPDVFKFGWPPVFLSIWLVLLDKIHKVRDFSKLAIGLPRGFAKTTMVKLAILFIILFSKRKFVLILAKTEKHAVNIISDIVDMLNEPNIIKLFGDWKIGLSIDQQALKKFSFRGRDIIIAGLGAGGSVRGLNIKNARPDVMVFEDIQSREDADSETISDGLYKWMNGTAMKAKSPTGCLMLFIANMYPTPHSILKKLCDNSTWTKFIAGGILTDPVTGKLSSLWEDLQPLDQLLTEFQSDLESGFPEIFYAEVLNDPNASVNNKVDVSKIPRFDYDAQPAHQGSFIVIDPASGKAKGDDISIGYFEIFEGKPCLRELKCGKFSPGDTIWKTLEICQRRGCGLVMIEGNAYQESLAYWFKFICEQIKLEGIQALPIYSGKAAKNARIIRMFVALAKGEILLHDEVRAEVFIQVTGFAPLREDNTDGILDLLTYAPRIIAEFEDAIVNSTIIEAQILDSSPLLTYEEVSII